MRKVFFVDLDDTLFQTLPKCGDERDLVAASYASDGTAHSFMTPRQAAFFEWISAAGEVIPTTARTVSGLRRARLPFSSRAVCSFGAAILRADGSRCPAWDARVAASLEGTAETMADLSRDALGLAAARGLRVRTTLAAEEGPPLYLSVKDAGADPAGFAALAADLGVLAPPGWTVHHNTVSIALFPPGVGKEHAVAEIIRELGRADTVFVGVGDSVTDLPFMALCDWAMAPGGSQALGALGAARPEGAPRG